MNRATLLHALAAAGLLGLTLSAALGSSACSSTACVQWSADRGACPSAEQARLLFGGCTDIATVDGAATADGNLCCYPVTKVGNGIICTDDVGSGPVPVPPESSVGTGPNPSCDFQGFCGDSFSGCAGCAANGPCVDFFNACLNNLDCDTLRTCLDVCAPGDADCKGTCLTQHQAGQALYAPLGACVFCKMCPTDCNASQDLCSLPIATTGAGGMGGAGGMMTGAGGMMTGAGGGGGKMTGAGGMMTGAGGAGGMMTGAGGAGGTMTGAGGAGGKGG